MFNLLKFMNKQLKLRLRQTVNEMYFKKKYAKEQIKEQLRVSWDFVMAWTQLPNQDFTKDMRGWPKGKERKHSKIELKRIKAIHQELVKDP